MQTKPNTIDFMVNGGTIYFFFYMWFAAFFMYIKKFSLNLMFYKLTKQLTYYDISHWRQIKPQMVTNRPPYDDIKTKI